ncbi:FmdB family zinc ribbon protein [Deinococcus ruber]|uniref:Putative regulatory protein FmdB zinc ribbon domain-containing protein n=1 Tax=Deinococcus ruber TaxID=1848197 RepID=A0A918BV94_9DEIO|nr:FmdB family zinc ribbon protein [Deinococcus ruber]GGQ94438.1 hypothetical protein GCM10008957_03230 [Deinococcus ruber]
MPTYEYKNIETGERYEFKQSMKDAALTHHPETGVPIRRIVSRPAIAFKGSGFYANDSRSSSGGSSEKTSSAGSSSSDKSGSDSKASSDKAAPATPAPATPKGGE